MAPKIEEVSVAAFAGLIGKTSQRVYQMIQKGMPHRKRNTGTKIVPREAIQWMLEDVEEEAKAQTPPGLPIKSEEEAYKTRAERLMVETKLAELRRELVPLADYTEFSERLIGGFAAVAAGRLQRFEREMIKVKTPVQARELRDKMHESLMHGAREFATELDEEAAEMEKATAAGVVA